MKRSFAILLVSMSLMVSAIPAFAAATFPVSSSTPPAGTSTAPKSTSAIPANCNDPKKLCNPLPTDDFNGLLVQIGVAIRDIAIPIAVIVIIWAGIQFLTANGSPEKISTAKKALWYAIIGLAIIFIGTGFVDLIKSILSLKGS